MCELLLFSDSRYWLVADHRDNQKNTRNFVGAKKILVSCVLFYNKMINFAPHKMLMEI